jgi:hypothetical protein
MHRVHGGKDCIEGSRFDCLPQSFTPFYDGFSKAGLPLSGDQSRSGRPMFGDTFPVYRAP